MTLARFGCLAGGDSCETEIGGNTVYQIPNVMFLRFPS